MVFCHFFQRSFFLLAWIFCLQTSEYTAGMRCPGRPEENVVPPGRRVADNCKLSCHMGAENRISALQQPVLLTADPSLQLPFFFNLMWKWKSPFCCKTLVPLWFLYCWTIFMFKIEGNGLIGCQGRRKQRWRTRTRLNSSIYSSIYPLGWLVGPGKYTFCLCFQTLLLSLDESVQGKLPKLVHLLGPGHG